MLLKRLTLPFVCVLLVLGWAGSASAQKTFLLGPGSGAQLQIGGGLPLPIQLTDANMDMTPDWGATPTLLGLPAPIMASTIPSTMGVGAGVFPPLLIPVNPTGPGTVKSNGTGGLTVPTAVLARKASQFTLGQGSNNPALFAVATNLEYKWPWPGTAMLNARTMTASHLGASIMFPVNSHTVYLGASTVGTMAPFGAIRYVNSGQPFFGGFGRFLVTPMTGTAAPPFSVPCPGPLKCGPLKSSGGVTVYAIAGAGVAALIKASPMFTGAAGGKALQTVFTPGGNFVGKDIYAIGTAASPKGTIVHVSASLATGPAPTNMASSNGFFWTTGRITVSQAGAFGSPERFVLSGEDNRGPGGGGSIQLVAGALSQRPTSGPNSNRGWVNLRLLDPEATPSLSNGALAVLSASLLAMALFAIARGRGRKTVA